MPAQSCRCNNELPKPGSVRIAVWCADCQGFMHEIPGDIDEQLIALADIAEVIHIVRDVKEIAARVKARGDEQYDGSDSPGHTVTMTEVWGDEGFRPFG